LELSRLSVLIPVGASSSGNHAITGKISTLVRIQ